MSKLTKKKQAENAILWINRLSTTRVKQGTGKLGNSKIGYCCLGYGCKVLKLDYDPSVGVSEEFQEAVGLNVINGYIANSIVLNRRNHASLAALNDYTDSSFRVIASIIKKRAEDIFEYKVGKLVTEHFKTK